MAMAIYPLVYPKHYHPWSPYPKFNNLQLSKPSSVSPNPNPETHDHPNNHKHRIFTAIPHHGWNPGSAPGKASSVSFCYKSWVCNCCQWLLSMQGRDMALIIWTVLAAGLVDTVGFLGYLVFEIESGFWFWRGRECWRWCGGAWRGCEGKRRREVWETVAAWSCFLFSNKNIW